MQKVTRSEWPPISEGKKPSKDVANRRFNLTGVTTNPSILSKENKAPDFILKRLLDIQPGYVAAQVVVDDLAGMLKQAVL